MNRDDTLKVDNLEETLKFQQAIMRSAQTTQDDAYYERTRAHLVKVISLHQRQLDELEHNRLHADEIISECRRQMKILGKRIRAVKNRREIEKLQELQAKIQEMREAGVDVDAILAQMEAGQ